MWASTLSQHYQQRTSLEMWFKHQYRRIASDVCWSDFRNHSSSPWLFPDSDYSLFRCKSLSSFIKRSSFEFLTFFLQISVIIGNFCNDASHNILTLLKFLILFRFEFTPNCLTWLLLHFQVRHFRRTRHVRPLQRERQHVVRGAHLDELLLLADLRHRPSHAGVGGVGHPRLLVGRHPDYHHRKYSGKSFY